MEVTSETPARRRRGWLAASGLAVAVVLIASFLRVGLELVVPGVAPFALLYPAILGATLLMGWRSGVVALALGAALAWFVVMTPRYDPAERTAADAINLLLYLLTTGAIVVFAEAFRARTHEALKGQAVLRQTASRLSLAMDAAHMAVWQLDGQRLIPNPELNRLLGFDPDAKVELAEIEARFDQIDYRRIRRLSRRTLAQGGRFLEVEQLYRHPDGRDRWMLWRAEFVEDAEGRLAGSIGVVLDLTERKTAEDRVRLLAREVDHRANNLLTVVQGTVALSRAPTVERLKAVITGRISALARAHQLLSRTRWQGADLRRLVEEELAPFSLGDDQRVRISGPDLALGPAAAQAIAMALHELATNAAKYGALSTPEGRVEVVWTGPEIDPLMVRWTETGGPPVSFPRKRGLGATMLARALEGPLQGKTRLDWRPEGVVCELTLPRSAAAALDVAAA